MFAEARCYIFVVISYLRYIRVILGLSLRVEFTFCTLDEYKLFSDINNY